MRSCNDRDPVGCPSFSHSTLSLGFLVGPCAHVCGWREHYPAGAM